MGFITTMAHHIVDEDEICVSLIFTRFQVENEYPSFRGRASVDTKCFAEPWRD